MKKTLINRIFTRDELNKALNRLLKGNGWKKYYLKASLAMGFWEPSPYIALIHESEGEQAVEGLTYATMIR